jgi:peptidoglycan L-alanyl-D-glutamate endopeptidase CwlK
MSAPIVQDEVLFFQRLLRSDGLYDGELDGLWGPKTEKGAAEFERRANSIQLELGTFDVRSERCIRSLSLRAQPQARLCLARLINSGFVARIISGTRTYAEQEKLYAQGRFGNPGRVITKARGGESNHNFGVAWDIGLFGPKGEYLTDTQVYDDAARAGKSDFLEWGGDWRTLHDAPHYQLKLGLTLADLREVFEGGTPGQAFA